MIEHDSQFHIDQRVRPALGTLLAIEVAASDAKTAQAGLSAAFAAVDLVASLMHPAAVDGDLQRIARAPENEPVAVHAWTWRLLRLCHDLHAASAGLFDPCLALRAGRLSALVLGEDSTVTRCAPLSIDLGGIAKGFAVDRAIDALLAHGCRCGLVNAGGDLRVFGDTPRTVLIRSAAGTLIPMEVANAALAVSAPRSDGSPREHQGFYRGTTGEVVQGRWIAVTAPEAAIADGLTKCALLCPAPMLAAILRRYGACTVNAVET